MKISVAAICSVLALSLAACGGGGTSDFAGSPAVSSVQRTTVVRNDDGESVETPLPGCIRPIAIGMQGTVDVPAGSSAYAGHVFGGSASLTFDDVTNGGRLDYAFSTTLPAGIPPYVTALDTTRYAYLTLKPRSTITVAANSAINASFIDRTKTFATRYSLALYDGSRWIGVVAVAERVGAGVGSRVTEPRALTLEAGKTYVLLAESVEG